MSHFMPLMLDIQLHPAVSRHISNLANTLPIPAPGLKNGSDTAPIVTAPQTGNALPQPRAAEHNTPPAYENDRCIA